MLKRNMENVAITIKNQGIFCGERERETKRRKKDNQEFY